MSGIGLWVPDVNVDAIEDAHQAFGARLQQAAQAHAALFGGDLRGVAGRHRRHLVGELDARLQEADLAPILDALDRERFVAAGPACPAAPGNKALESQVVDRQNHRRRLEADGPCAARRKGRPASGPRANRGPGSRRAGSRPGGQGRSRRRPWPGRRTASRCRAIGSPGSLQVRIARPVIEMRRVDDQQLERAGPAAQQPGRPAHQFRKAMDFLAARAPPSPPDSPARGW
jgi:hypothetical protein